jgi:hypothetical protein
MTQTPKRRPKAVTQRDGSSLQNANCRMASISTGLDFHTVGARTATAGKMRTYTSDQTGGTGSDDAKQAWQNGYKQSLVIKDGGSWASVTTALHEGRGVNLDVWHASLPGGCVSGEGKYGHNIFVLPDQNDDGWLVSDPWCKPAVWKRISTTQLKRAAEEWGAKVRSQTGMRDPSTILLRAAALVLMRLWQPGREMPEDDPLIDVHPDDDDDTGGYTPIMFTTTNRQPLATSGGATDVGPTFKTTSPAIGKATVKSDVSIIACSDGEFHDTDVGLVRNVYEEVTITDGKYDNSKAYLVIIPGSEEMGLLLAAACDYVPNPPSGGDNAARDEEWREWLLDGSPGS